MMNIICPGWGEPRVHDPVVIGQKPGDGDSHGMCGECRITLRAMERVRITALINEQVISYVCDRLGAALRLKMARRLPGFRGHSIQAVI